MASDSGASDSGADSDLIRWVTFAGKHSVALGKTIKSYKPIRPQVCALVKETSALAEALDSLIDAASANTESQIPAMLLSAAEETLEIRITRLDDMLAQNLTGVETESDLVQINKEMQSAEQCLRICAEFSEHLAEAQVTNANKSPRSNNKGNIEFDSASEESTGDGLQDLQERASRMRAQLKSNENRRFDDFVQKVATINNPSATAASELAAELATMKKDFNFTREVADELSSTIAKLEMEKASGFENDGKGDLLQFFVSTKGKTLRGKNKWVGGKVQQFLGYAEDDTVKQVSKDMSKNSYLSVKTSEELSKSADAVMARVVHGKSEHRPGPLAIAFTSLHPATSHVLLANVRGSR
ncbi:hypothetical protein Sste5344_009280 [Sporothrix stenoceras]